jgi:lysozyme
VISGVADLIRARESLRLAAYDDATGKPVPAGGACIGTITIGYGHTGADVHPGQTITEAEAEALLWRDIRAATIDAAVVVGSQYWQGLNDARRACLTDMAFNLGRSRLAGFAKMIAAIRRGNFEAAAREALDSAWAEQVPSRAKVDAEMLRSGGWPFDVAA